MTGETNLDVLLKTMSPVLYDDTYVFHSSNISFEDAAKLNPVLIFREEEGTALILKKEDAESGNLDYIYPARTITLNIHSSLEAIGFLAKITRKLADRGISVNPVSAHFHDHLFVPVDKAELAMQALREFQS